MLGTGVAIACFLLRAPVWIYALGCVVSTLGAIAGWIHIGRKDRA